jgi:hypothetical protein
MSRTIIHIHPSASVLDDELDEEEPMDVDDIGGYRSRYDRMAAGGHTTHFGHDSNTLPGIHPFHPQVSHSVDYPL